MADGSLPGVESLRNRVSAEEWQLRVELAAMYRLCALEKWDDLIGTHISARVPGPDHHFLINPFGLRFKEITASSLVKVDLEENILSPTGWGINYAGFVIHSAIHAAREDAKFVIHFHSDDGVAVSAQKEGILPLDQRSVGVARKIAYHDYEGVAVDLSERERLVRDLGSANMMMLRNHGTLALGASAGLAWLAIRDLEKICTTQVRALSAGRDGVLFAPEALQHAPRPATGDNKPFANYVQLAWDALMRQAHDESPGFDA